MEVKINREIRDYTESMFFGLSMRQFIFSILAVAVAVILYFALRGYFRHRHIKLDVRARRGPLRGSRFRKIQRHDL